MVQSIFRYLEPFWRDSRVCHADRRMDGQTSFSKCRASQFVQPKKQRHGMQLPIDNFIQQSQR